MLFIVAIIFAIIAVFVYVNLKKSGKKQESTFSMLVIIGAAVIAAIQMFTVVPAGTVGVVDFFGNVSDNTLKAGVSMVNPLANVSKFSIKKQEFI